MKNHQQLFEINLCMKIKGAQLTVCNSKIASQLHKMILFPPINQHEFQFYNALVTAFELNMTSSSYGKITKIYFPNDS